MVTWIRYSKDSGREPTDVRFHPSNPDVVYACNRYPGSVLGFFVSTRKVRMSRWYALRKIRISYKVRPGQSNVLALLL